MTGRLRDKDVLVLLLLGSTALAIGVGGYFLFGDPYWGLSATVIGVLLAAVILEERRQKWIRHKEVLRSVDKVYEQIDALISVRSELEINRSLPMARGWAASPDLLREIIEVIRTQSPQQVVEAGSGLSTIVVAQSLKKFGTGQTVALENGEEFAEEARKNMRHHDVEKFASVIHAPLRKFDINGEEYQWYDIGRIKGVEQKIDLLIVDGPPALEDPYARYPAVPLLWERLSSEAIILIDDGDREGEKKIVEKWCDEYDLESEYINLEKGLYMLRRK